MKVMLDGEYFGEWDGTLEEYLAMILSMGDSDITIDRLSWEPVSITVAKKTAVVANNDAYNAATQAITADYPQLEKDTWPTQDKEIKAYQANPENALTPWIDIASSVRGLTRIDYIDRTIAKVALFEQTSAYLTGLRQKYEDQIKAATTVAEVEALTFVYTLPGG